MSAVLDMEINIFLNKKKKEISSCMLPSEIFINLVAFKKKVFFPMFMFMAAPSTIAKTWKQQRCYPSTKWMNRKRPSPMHSTFLSLWCCFWGEEEACGLLSRFLFSLLTILKGEQLALYVIMAHIHHHGSRLRSDNLSSDYIDNIFHHLSPVFVS